MTKKNFSNRIQNLKYAVQPKQINCATLYSYANVVTGSIKKSIELLEYNRTFSKFVMLDCGVFTVRRRGLEVDLERYARFAYEVAKRGLVDIVINLDHGTTWNMRQNYKYIRKKVGDHAYTMWVHQPIMGFKALEKFVKDSPYVGLGTLGLDTGVTAVLRTPEVHRYYKECFNILKNEGSTAHGFAMTASNILLDDELPWGTCDSSSWSSSRRWGFQLMTCKKTGQKLRLPQPYNPANRKTDGGATISTMPLKKAMELLADYGLKFRDYQKLNGLEQLALAAVSNGTLEEFIRNKREEDTTICNRLKNVGLESLADTKNPFHLVLVLSTDESVKSIEKSYEIRKKQLLGV